MFHGRQMLEGMALLCGVVLAGLLFLAFALIYAVAGSFAATGAIGAGVAWIVVTAIGERKRARRAAQAWREEQERRRAHEEREAVYWRDLERREQDEPAPYRLD